MKLPKVNNKVKIPMKIEMISKAVMNTHLPSYVIRRTGFYSPGGSHPCHGFRTENGIIFWQKIQRNFSKFLDEKLRLKSFFQCGIVNVKKDICANRCPSRSPTPKVEYPEVDLTSQWEAPILLVAGWALFFCLFILIANMNDKGDT